LYQGSLLRQGLTWAAVVIAAVGVASLFSKARYYVLAMILIWTGLWCLIMYRNSKRHERRHEEPSRPR
jgi:Flp pilus assembly protein TadB